MCRHTLILPSPSVASAQPQVTTDFNFPRWRYFGQGSGENGGGYEYLLRPAAPAGI